MELKDKIEWVKRGYADGWEGSPRKRAPQCHPDILCLTPEQAPEEVRIYWEGFYAGVKDCAGSRKLQTLFPREQSLPS